MQYLSTRGSSPRVSSASAILKGIAPDGGLYIPERLPEISLLEVQVMATMTYAERAASILPRFLTDYSASQIAIACKRAYNGSFDDPAVAPVHTLEERHHVLELWHGPTQAFKDVALQLCPYLLSDARQMEEESHKILILVATSGDTGKAALEGFCEVPGIEIIVFYPENGVSFTQQLQMVTQRGGNVHVVAVDGNFDDTQNGVKAIFSDVAFNEVLRERGVMLSSANSINWGRLVPQIVYYFSAYLELMARQSIQIGQEINFVVPTGNFGNILAAYYAKKMGLPIGKLICASNQNNVLTDFFNEGRYDANRTFYRTASPSMDILISSNLERLLYHICDEDAQQVGLWMQALKENGRYEIDARCRRHIEDTFYAGYADDEQALKTIREVYHQYGYVLDTHTAVAQRVAWDYEEQSGDMTPTVIVSTASPYKFCDHVLQALDQDIQSVDPSALPHQLHQLTGMPIPLQMQQLFRLPVLHRGRCGQMGMREAVLECL